MNWLVGGRLRAERCAGSQASSTRCQAGAGPRPGAAYERGDRPSRTGRRRAHLEPGLGLGHRRLSIIDIATGQQPLFNEDGSVVVVYNGEIYNFQELIPELQALGHEFRTQAAIPR